MPVKCSVLGCNNSRSNSTKLRYHKFPTDPVLLELWKFAIGRKNFVPKKCSRICGDHFSASDYLKLNNGFCYLLKPGVVPSIFTHSKNVDSPDSSITLPDPATTCHETDQESPTTDDEALDIKQESPGSLEDTYVDLKQLVVRLDQTSITSLQQDPLSPNTSRRTSSRIMSRKSKGNVARQRYSPSNENIFRRNSNCNNVSVQTTLSGDQIKNDHCMATLLKQKVAKQDEIIKGLSTILMRCKEEGILDSQTVKILLRLDVFQHVDSQILLDEDPSLLP